MIDLTINLPEGKTVEIRNLTTASVSTAIVSEAFNAAKLCYPDWTSIMIVVVNTRIAQGQGA